MLKKRFLGVMSILVAGGLIVSGCSSSGGSKSSSGKNSSSDQKVTITFWNAYSATSGEEKMIKTKVIPAFEKAHPNITVKNVTLPYDNMQSKLLTSAAGGELPDVARLDIIWIAQLAKLGALVPEDKLSGFDSLKQQVFKGPLSTNYYNKTYYGLPLDTNTKVLYSNTNVLKKNGINQPPKTMNDFVTDIKKTTSGSGKHKVYGYTMGTDLWNLIPWIASYGGSVLSPDGKKADGYLNGAKTVKAVTTVVDLFKQGYITGLLPGANGDTSGLGSGQYAMIDEGPWDVPTMKATYPKVKYTMTLFPAGSGGSKQVVGGEDIGVFNTDQSHEKASWEFEKFMLSPKIQGWMQSVGQMSVLKNLPSSDMSGADYFGIYRKQLASSVSRPVTPNYTKVDTYINNAVQSAAQGKISVKAALDKAVQQVDAVLTQN